MRSNLILTGGINHDFLDTAEALAEVLADAGFDSIITDDITAGFEQLQHSSFDLVTMFTLRWRMLDDDKYIPHRAEWAYEINDQDRTNITNHVSNGGGLLGLHTASICFDTWPEWPDLLGAKWVWQQTFHPPPAELTIAKESDHPITQDLDDFQLVDELYHNLEAASGSVPLLSTKSAEDGADHTIAFAKESGAGRSVYNALGHDRASMQAEGHARFLKNAANWCAP